MEHRLLVRNVNIVGQYLISPASKYNDILNYQYNQLKQVQTNLEVQLAMEELSNHIKEQQLKTCHEILQTKNSPLTYLRKPKFRFRKKKDYESKNWK